MNVHVVCRLNQARSIIASAALRKMFPQLQIFSSGVSARSGAPIPLSIRDTARRWGLEELDYLSSNLSDHHFFSEDDLLLCADDSISEHLTSIAIPVRCVDVTDFSIHELLLPHDPISMDVPAMEQELAKMIVASTRALNFHMQNSKASNVDALIYPTREYKSVIDYITDWHQRFKGRIIDMDWKIPDSSIWNESEIPTQTFNPRHPAMSLSDELEVLTSAYEIDTSIDILTGLSLKEFLTSSEVPALLLIGVGNLNVPSPESIACLIHSHAIKIFGQSN